jgi:hypothetical protein
MLTTSPGSGLYAADGTKLDSDLDVSCDGLVDLNTLRAPEPGQVRSLVSPCARTHADRGHFCLFITAKRRQGTGLLDRRLHEATVVEEQQRNVLELGHIVPSTEPTRLCVCHHSCFSPRFRF